MKCVFRYFSPEQIQFLRKRTRKLLMRHTQDAVSVMLDEFYYGLKETVDQGNNDKKKFFETLQYKFMMRSPSKNPEEINILSGSALQKFASGYMSKNKGQRIYTTPYNEELNVICCVLINEGILSNLMIDKINGDYSIAFGLEEKFPPLLDNPQQKIPLGGVYEKVDEHFIKAKTHMLCLDWVDKSNFLSLRESEIQKVTASSKNQETEKIFDRVILNSGWCTLFPNQEIVCFSYNKAEPKLSKVFSIAKFSQDNEVDTESLITNQIAKISLSGYEEEKQETICRWKKEETDKFDSLINNMAKFDNVDETQTNHSRSHYRRRTRRLQKPANNLEKRSIEWSAANTISGSGVSEKANNVTQELEKRFFDSIWERNNAEFDKCLNEGVDVNCVTALNFHPIHKAAAVLNIYAIEKLLERDDVEYLVITDTGCLPSELAEFAAGNPTVGQLLEQKEMQEVDKKGLSYDEIVNKADQVKIAYRQRGVVNRQPFDNGPGF